MNSSNRLKTFAEHVRADVPLPDLIAELRQLREAGISAEAVRSLLEELRTTCSDTALEDRILEVMDFVTGFCSAENSIWPETNAH